MAIACWAASVSAELVFRCPGTVEQLHMEMGDYLLRLEIPSTLVKFRMDSNSMTAALTTPVEDELTLDFILRPEFSLTTETVQLPTGGGKFRPVITVSRKEILLALLQHGRRIEFSGQHCSIAALEDHVGIRQNIVAWAESLSWIWPDGEAARWNRKYWKRGTPRKGVPVHVAVMDVFLHQKKYAIGCYTATKLIYVQGLLDFYRRVKPDAANTSRLERILMADGEPLVDIEPGRMWSFEKGFDPSGMAQPGKLLDLQSPIASGNFVPGDWGYLLNTDARTYEKTGYEGSNAIYLGRNQFDDYYNEHRHRYTYQEKLEEVYQWRNDVFNRTRDEMKIQPLTLADRHQLGSTPSAGGLQMDFRAIPRQF